MADTRRLVEAAASLSTLLRSKKVGHAFYGTVLVAALSNYPECDVRATHVSAAAVSHGMFCTGNILRGRRGTRPNTPISSRARLCLWP